MRNPLSFLSAVLTSVIVLQYVAFAHAGVLSVISDKQSTIKASTKSNHEISFRTASQITSGQTIVLNFGSGSVGTGVLFTDVDLSVGGTAATIAAANAAAVWGFALSSTTAITFTAPSSLTTIATGTDIVIKIGTNATVGATGVNQFTNPATTGTQVYTIYGTIADTGTISVPIVAQDTVRITALVPQSISYILSTSTAYFGTLLSTAAQFASSTNTSGDTASNVAHTVTIGTNAASGYVLTVQGDTLRHTGSTTLTISPIGASAAASSVGSEQFGLNVSSTNTNAIIATRYGTASQYAFGASTSTADVVASSTAATAQAIFQMAYLANINALTEAGTYQTDLTYVVTGNY